MLQGHSSGYFLGVFTEGVKANEATANVYSKIEDNSRC